jgi:hypothetical protein
MGIEGLNDAELPCGIKKVLVSGMEKVVEKEKLKAMSVEIQENDCEEEQGGITTLDSTGCTDQEADEKTKETEKRKLRSKMMELK